MEIFAVGLLLTIIFFFFQGVVVPVLKHFGIIAAAKLDDVQIDNLSKYSPYYRKLKIKYKKEFRKRVSIFINSKKFIARNMDSVTDEMKIVVASFAVQLTFGLPKIYLAHFDRILLYPDNYYSTVNNQYHKGEVNPRFGIIVLSWTNLVSGIANETDGINLGIHELAHAIHLENRISNSEYGFFAADLWKEYSDLAEFEMNKIQVGEPTFFRARAGIDHYEFFAVLLENFFEKPQELKKYSPTLYKSTTLLLRQDPLKLLMYN